MGEFGPGGPARGEPGLFYFLRLAWRRWRFLAAASLLAGLLTLGIGFLLPRWYVARASVLPPREVQPSLLAAQGLTAALQLESVLPLSAGVTFFDVYMAVLNSDTVARTLVERFDIKKRYDQELMVRAIERLRSHTVIAQGENRIIEISAEDRDPQFAAELANAYVEELRRVLRETRSSAGRRQREFLEARLGRARAELDSSEAALAEASAGAGLPTLSRDLTEAATAAGELIGRRLLLAVQLELLDAMGVREAPMRRQLEAELRAVDLEAAGLPGLGLGVARKLRDVRMNQVLYEALAHQLEAARIEEVRDTPPVEVLDVAVPPDRHARPRKGLMAIAGALAGAALGFVWVVYADPRP